MEEIYLNLSKYNMNFKEWLLTEMPLKTAERLGGGWNDTKNKHWWDSSSIKLLQSDKALNKIRNIWKDTDHDYDIYFLKAKGMRDTLEKGEVDVDYVRNELGIKDFQNDENAITIIFTNNRGADRQPMTAWTMAHRFAHAMASSDRGRRGMYSQFTDKVNSDFRKLLYKIYGHQGKTGYDFSPQTQKYLKELMQGLGTMKSARNKQLFRPGEFTHELVAQYILTGEVKFNTNFPKAIDRRMAWGNEYHNRYSKLRKDSDIQNVQYEIEDMADTYNWMINDLLDYSISRIYVM